MGARHLAAVRQLTDIDVSFAFPADEGGAWRRTAGAAVGAVTIATVVAFDPHWSVAVVCVVLSAVLAQAVGARRRIVAIAPDSAVICATAPLSLRPTAHRLIDLVDRLDTARSRTGIFTERWRFGGRVLTVRHEQGAALAEWQTAP